MLMSLEKWTEALEVYEKKLEVAPFNKVHPFSSFCLCVCFLGMCIDLCMSSILFLYVCMSVVLVALCICMFVFLCVSI
jgi:hypothetical protein